MANSTQLNQLSKGTFKKPLLLPKLQKRYFFPVFKLIYIYNLAASFHPLSTS
jgi:hypothetical protein